MTHIILSETLDLSETSLDEQNRTLQGVVLIRAGTSKNKRYYGESVLQAAAPIFENAPAYADHPQKPGQGRSIREFTGQYKNVRYENGALRADRVFAGTLAGQDALAIARDIIEGRITPNVAGLSINAVGSGKNAKREDGDVFEVESISAAQSVDDVANPAAGGSYRESTADSDLLLTAIREMEYREWFDASGEHVKKLQKEMKTTRQDEALSAAQAVADDLRRQLDEAQAQNETLKAEREAAIAEAQSARRAREIDQRLQTVNVPKGWLDDLRARLMEADTAQWSAILETEEAKAKAAGHRIAVTGAGQQVGAPFVEATKPTGPQLIDMRQFKSPEDFAAYTQR